MIFSEREQQYRDKAIDLLKGRIFSEQEVCENGIFEKAGVAQSLAIRTRINQTKHPYRKYYDIKNDSIQFSINQKLLIFLS